MGLPQGVRTPPATHVRVDHRNERHRLARRTALVDEEGDIGRVQLHRLGSWVGLTQHRKGGRRSCDLFAEQRGNLATIGLVQASLGTLQHGGEPCAEGDVEEGAFWRRQFGESVQPRGIGHLGDVAEMTYAAWLNRFAELTAPEGSFLDVTFSTRFTAMLQRAEARLDEADRGQIPTLFGEEITAPATALAMLGEAHPGAESVQLHPADVAFFVDQCRAPGKPVPFVPVIDADVRRWWRSDSLWQAHDARYDADQVCIIPGTVSVAGIERVDEPVADLLQRFEDATVDTLLAAGRAPLRVASRRRSEGINETLGLVLAAHDVVWAGRTVQSPVRRLGSDWVVVDDIRAEHPATGAVLDVASATAVDLTVPLATPLVLRIDLPATMASGAAPIVSTTSATTAMAALVQSAAGGELPNGTTAVAWNPDLVADHVGVTGDTDVAHPLPD